MMYLNRQALLSVFICLYCLPVNTGIYAEVVETPSEKCQQIVKEFASAISNFTLCSVSNARPIHMCQWCIYTYLTVLDSHNQFVHTVDEKGNPCKDYFTNWDRVQIVTEAYKYVNNLWNKGKCNYCFEKSPNGTLEPRATNETVKFEMFYELTRSCFKNHENTNETCQACRDDYENLNQFYIKIGERSGENICLDIVDTMNTTRQIWSQELNCNPKQKVEFWLYFAMGLVSVCPVIFYVLACLLSNKQETRVLQQRRLAEVFAVNSQSGALDSSGRTVKYGFASGSIYADAAQPGPGTSASFQDSDNVISKILTRRNTTI